MLSKDIANYKINIDIKSSRIKENIIEVLTSINLQPTNTNLEKINTEIVYAAIIELDTNKIEKEELEKIILVEVPTQIYSELRQIFIYLFERSGFREVKINETVDFQKLYNMKKFQ